MPPKNASKKKKKEDAPKKTKLERKKELQKLRRKKGIPAYVFKFRKPSRRIGSGGVLKKSHSLGRLMKWPKYVKLQRQRKILLQRLKVPPALNIFDQGCAKDFAKKIVEFSKNYSPETSKQKQNRLRAMAKLQAEGKPVPSEKKNTIKYGFNHVTNLIESGRAKLVVIAHDVDPIELVLWMPALCIKKNVPFVIFKSKARLGALVNKKTASCMALCEVNPGDVNEFKNIQKKAKQTFNNRYNTLKKKWGKRVLGQKTRHRIDKRKRVRKAEAARRKAAQQ